MVEQAYFVIDRLLIVDNKLMMVLEYYDRILVGFELYYEVFEKIF